MNRIIRSKLAEYARYMRKNMPPTEKTLWYQFLRNYPIRFSRQILIGPYIVDFYCGKLDSVLNLMDLNIMKKTIACMMKFVQSI